MAKAKGITTRTVRLPTKVTPVWQIGIIFPNGNKIMKPKCTLNEVFLTYFLDLEKYLDKSSDIYFPFIFPQMIIKLLSIFQI